MNKLFVVLTILLICVTLIGGCSTANTTTTRTTPAASTRSNGSPGSINSSSAPTTRTIPIYGGTLRYITSEIPQAPFGVPWLSDGTSIFSMQFSEQFLVRELANGSFQPDLATSWDFNTGTDKPSITFHLRKGVKFSDGSDFNAQAVEWNLDQEMSPDSTNLGTTGNWKAIDVLDSYTIRINLKTWQNTAMDAFAGGTSFMVSPTAYQKKGPVWMEYNMVGTGPFNQKSYSQDVSLDFVRNPNYWQAGQPYLDSVSLVFVADDLTAQALFNSGGGDIIQSFSDQMTSNLRQAGDKIVTAKVPTGNYLWPDSANADSPWSNAEVREAAEYAIDKTSLAKAFGYGDWTPAYQYNTSVSPAYDNNLVPRTFNLIKAKQLLADAGYPIGFKTTIIVSPIGADLDVAEALQAMWKAAGIQASLRFPEVDVFSSILTGTWNNGVILDSEQLSANPLAGWATIFGQGSPWFGSMARPAGIGELMTQALTTPKLEPDLAKQIEDTLFNDHTVIPLWFNADTWAVTDKVMDSGLGTRNLSLWFEPQNTWMSK